MSEPKLKKRFRPWRGKMKPKPQQVVPTTFMRLEHFRELVRMLDQDARR